MPSFHYRTGHAKEQTGQGLQRYGVDDDGQDQAGRAKGHCRTAAPAQERAERKVKIPEDARTDPDEGDDETVVWDCDRDAPMWIDGADDSGISGDNRGES